ncbi:hypothetical protein HZU67_06159 [Apis mellifera carnica]|nr:hypothetical protein HZU67_06159 [Apis mellifera carnica]
MKKESGFDNNGTATPGPSKININCDIKNTSSIDNNMISPSPRKKFRKNTFRDAWLQDPDFALWLQKCEDPYKARCIVCKKTLITGKSTLQKHNRTLLHKRNMKGKKNEEEELKSHP